MLHRVSISARNPEQVARVLAELLGGDAGPFIGPIPGPAQRRLLSARGAR
jgi:hypothetical protein